MDDPVNEMIGILALVGNRRVSSDAVDKIMCEGDVVALSGRTDQPDRIAQRIAGSMDFGAQAATRATQALGIRPPFTRRAPAAC